MCNIKTVLCRSKWKPLFMLLDDLLGLTVHQNPFCGRGSVQDPAGEAYDSPHLPSRLGRGYTLQFFTGRLRRLGTRACIIRPRRSRSAAAYSRQTFPWTICRSVGLSSALWKSSGSDPDAVWHHRSDGSRDEAGSGVWGSVHGKGYFGGGEFGRVIVTIGDFTA